MHKKLRRSLLTALVLLSCLPVLFVIVRFAMRLVKTIFQGIESGQLKIGGFETEWALPTYRLTRLLIIAFALVVAYPYIPGSSSEAMLLEAARATEGGHQDRAFVLLKELGDFAVVYELNVPCAEPARMEALYSELHRNILDAFNKYGVQIMTPAYEGDTSDPKIVAPARWFAAPAVPPKDPQPRQTG